MLRRRDFVTAVAAAGVAAAQTPAPVARKGRLKQCVTRGVFGQGMSFEDMCREAARLGCHGFDLARPADWPTLRKYGLKCTMAPPNRGVTIPDGINQKEKHDALEKTMRASLNECAANGVESIITVSGSRRGMSDAEGIENCVAFLNRVKAQAEGQGVTIAMELLNSKIDHPDQQCDHTAFGVEVCRRVNSPRVRLLYDIYHMQIMEGDICRTIRNNFQWLSHFHTGGVPGRHEIDGTQELNYHFVAQTLADLNFSGYIAHEYKLSPGHDPIKTLNQAIEIMDV
jgi:hydroxypyruvate isomerase